jgi:hypothetical protein
MKNQSKSEELRKKNEGKIEVIMWYSEGNLERVFILRMDHGEDLIAMLQKFLREEIESCMALFQGPAR